MEDTQQTGDRKRDEGTETKCLSGLSRRSPVDISVCMRVYTFKQQMFLQENKCEDHPPYR